MAGKYHYSCYQCDHMFTPALGDALYGWCRRHAPRREDYENGEGLYNDLPFPFLDNVYVISCGEFKQCTDPRPHPTWEIPGFGGEQPPTPEVLAARNFDPNKPKEETEETEKKPAKTTKKK